MAGPIPFSLLPDNSEVGDAGQLIIGGCDTLDLTKEYGTPLFVYDEAHIRVRCQEAVASFGEDVAYAAKAFLCLAMARLVEEEKMCMDVATAGEMYVAISGGFSPSRLIFHGNNKSYGELRTAFRAGVGRIVVDSFQEMDRIEELHRITGKVPRVLVRVTPGVSAHTHEYISTGQDDTKFGFTVSSGLAEHALERMKKSSAVELSGIHAHIGSQIFSAENLSQAAQKVAEFAAPYELEELSIGGGLGVAYVEGETAPSISEWAEIVKSACAGAGVKSRILAEPGRSIVASSAVTLYKAGTIKNLDGIRTYVSVDGGMSDNPRPVLYGSGYETFLVRDVKADRPQEIALVGKHCESGDLLVKEGYVPEDLMIGDILATPVSGAYGHSMGSNYNKVLRPAVLFVKDGDVQVAVTRESYEDLLRHDTGPRAVLGDYLRFGDENEDSNDSVA